MFNKHRYYLRKYRMASHGDYVMPDLPEGGIRVAKGIHKIVLCRKYDYHINKKI